MTQGPQATPERLNNAGRLEVDPAGPDLCPPGRPLGSEVGETSAAEVDEGDGGGASWPDGFEEDDALRSEFIRRWMMRPSSWLKQHVPPGAPGAPGPPRTQSAPGAVAIPRTLIRFWHDLGTVPADVAACMDSWGRLRDEGLRFRFFDDVGARHFIANRYGARELAAYALCPHPAMRSDYLRLCVVLADGGLYVDADDVLRDDRWRDVFATNTLKLQPLCYDIATDAMVHVEGPQAPARTPETPDRALDRARDRPTPDRIHYVNNNPLAAPAGHPVVRRALTRATRLLLAGNEALEVQSTTGPGNLTAALAAHLHHSSLADMAPEVELLADWEATAEPSWVLAYRSDDRNWRLWDWRQRREPGQHAELRHRQHQQPRFPEQPEQPEQPGQPGQPGRHGGPVDGGSGQAGAE